VKEIVEMDATVVASTPTLRAADGAGGEDARHRPRRSAVRARDPVRASRPVHPRATKALIEEQWGATAGDTAGMTELGTIMIFECASQPGGTHIIEDHYIEEVVDPVTDEPVPYGEMGNGS
jgi:phenylacetate-CoA ligase